jgi:electron transfer flavoprotein alpha subunit
MSANIYQHLYVVIEIQDDKLVPVSLEMLGKARELMDSFNTKYQLNEKVVAILLGHNIKEVCNTLIEYGADVVVFADSLELKDYRNNIYTKVISQIAQDEKIATKISPDSKFNKPRYMFFAADSIGRHLSSTVLVALDSGLASDINKLEINDITLTHQYKTDGKPIMYEKTLEMYRPDFSGFLWTTILCLDNKNPQIERDYHPQSCSIIPGVFEPITPHKGQKGQIIEYTPTFDQQDLRVKILSRKVIKNEVDFDSYKAVVSFGRGIKDAPEQNIRLVEQLAKALKAEIGVSLPISKKPFVVSESVSSKYMISDRIIGTSGRKISPMLYVAVGISGAMQHIAGMQDSRFVVAINPDENSPIKDECDVFIKGRLEDVVPKLVEEIKQSLAVNA